MAVVRSYLCIVVKTDYEKLQVMKTNSPVLPLFTSADVTGSRSGESRSRLNADLLRYLPLAAIYLLGALLIVLQLRSIL